MGNDKHSVIQIRTETFSIRCTYKINKKLSNAGCKINGTKVAFLIIKDKKEKSSKMDKIIL